MLNATSPDEEAVVNAASPEEEAQATSVRLHKTQATAARLHITEATAARLHMTQAKAARLHMTQATAAYEAGRHVCGLICIYTNIVHAWEYSHAKSMIVEFTVFNGVWSGLVWSGLVWSGLV